VSTKLKQLERLQRLRDARETLCEAKLAKAQGAVHGVTLQIAEADTMRRGAAGDGSAALLLGDRAEWWLAESARFAAERRGALLESLLRELAASAEEARGRLVTSRREAEQVSVVVKELRNALAAEDARRSQAVSDDRFAARAHWTRMRRMDAEA